MEAALGYAPDADEPLTRRQQERFHAFVSRRVRGEPVALIRGWMDFLDLRLTLRPGVFTPRNSTEHMAREAIRRLRSRRQRVSVDVATGAGPVALSIAHGVPGGQAWGIDISPDAVRLARANARRLRLVNARFRVSDMLGSLPRTLRGSVDLFTIHPPYVARGDVRTLPREIRDYEPRQSLTDSSDDGLGLVRRLVHDAPEWLSHNGAVMVEVAPYLAPAVRRLLRKGGFPTVEVSRDDVGATRVITGSRLRAGRASARPSERR
jgi:release factor glutamine methyltransferase